LCTPKLGLVIPNVDRFSARGVAITVVQARPATRELVAAAFATRGIFQ